jgi:hypothetical protein
MTRRDFHREHWMYGMAYGFYYYNTPFGVHPSLFYSPFNYGYMNPYYMYDPFGSPYGYYSSFYDPFYYGNGYYTYGYGYGNGYNYQNSNYGNPYQGSYTVLSNHHSGPRGSTSGFGNPNGRLQGNVLKTVQNPNPSSASNANFEGLRPTTQKALDRSKIIGEEVRGANNIALKPANTINSPTRQYRSTVDRGINSPSNTANSFNHNTNTQPVHHNAGNGGGRIDNMSGPRGSGSTNGGGNSGSGRSGGGSPSGGTRRH